jgi:predicted dithiol-disulfide oxidoreductase (DUF899 family)
MTEHMTATMAEANAAREKLRERENELTRLAGEIARERRELPWVRVDKQYTFDADDGPRTLADLFAGRSQLLIYHIMFGPHWSAACPACAALADHFDPMLPHLGARDVTLICASHAPLDKLQAYKKRMGWTFPYVSWSRSDYGYDFSASFNEEQQREVAAAVLGQFEGDEAIIETAASCGTDLRGYVITEGPGLSAFVLDDDTVYQTYSTLPQGGLQLGFQQYLDLAPRAARKASACAATTSTEHAAAASCPQPCRAAPGARCPAASRPGSPSRAGRPAGTTGRTAPGPNRADRPDRYDCRTVRA